MEFLVALNASLQMAAMKHFQFFVLAISLHTSAIAQSDWVCQEHIGGPAMDFGRIAGVDNAGNVYCYGNYGQPFYPEGQAGDLYIANDTLTGRNASFITKYNSSAGTPLVRFSIEGFAKGIYCVRVSDQSESGSKTFVIN